VKIFVSYSRRDADFAQQIDEYFQNSGHDVFTDVKDIQVGIVWSSAIETNISNCDIFVVIVTDPALRSPEVEKEVLQAQKENKKIIPCIYRYIRKDKIKWGVARIQGVEFDDKYQLARDLYSKIDIENYNSNLKITSSLSESDSTTLRNVKTTSISTKSDVDRSYQKKNILQLPKERTGAIGNWSSSPLKDTIKKYSFINSWGNEGTGNGKFAHPNHIVVAFLTRYVYVVDAGNNRIQKFDSDGNFITKWGSKGNRDGEFIGPAGVDVTFVTGEVYVIERGNHRIQKFDRNGNFITKWGNLSSREGSGDGEFCLPRGISINSSNIYVVDSENNRIQEFDSDGNFITKWGSKGTGDGELDIPSGISVDQRGYVYVTDTSNSRIQIFASPANK
jgi:DNA-binding beta-propeller fold protein YncE